LLSDLIERGLDADRARLWVIDGGKALRKALVQTCGTTALVQSVLDADHKVDVKPSHHGKLAAAPLLSKTAMPGR
jgi:hypothetical protein